MKVSRGNFILMNTGMFGFLTAACAALGSSYHQKWCTRSSVLYPVLSSRAADAYDWIGT